MKKSVQNNKKIEITTTTNSNEPIPQINPIEIKKENYKNISNSNKNNIHQIEVKTGNKNNINKEKQINYSDNLRNKYFKGTNHGQTNNDLKNNKTNQKKINAKKNDNLENAENIFENMYEEKFYSRSKKNKKESIKNMNSQYVEIDKSKIENIEIDLNNDLFKEPIPSNFPFRFGTDNDKNNNRIPKRIIVKRKIGNKSIKGSNVFENDIDYNKFLQENVDKSIENLKLKNINNKDEKNIIYDSFNGFDFQSEKKDDKKIENNNENSIKDPNFGKNIHSEKNNDENSVPDYNQSYMFPQNSYNENEENMNNNYNNNRTPLGWNNFPQYTHNGEKFYKDDLGDSKISDNKFEYSNKKDENYFPNKKNENEDNLKLDSKNFSSKFNIYSNNKIDIENSENMNNIQYNNNPFNQKFIKNNANDFKQYSSDNNINENNNDFNNNKNNIHFSNYNNQNSGLNNSYSQNPNDSGDGFNSQNPNDSGDGFNSQNPNDSGHKIEEHFENRQLHLNPGQSILPQSLTCRADGTIVNEEFVIFDNKGKIEIFIKTNKGDFYSFPFKIENFDLKEAEKINNTEELIKYFCKKKKSNIVTIFFHKDCVVGEDGEMNGVECYRDKLSLADGSTLEGLVGDFRAQVKNNNKLRSEVLLNLYLQSGAIKEVLNLLLADTRNLEDIRQIGNILIDDLNEEQRQIIDGIIEQLNQSRFVIQQKDELVNKSYKAFEALQRDKNELAENNKLLINLGKGAPLLSSALRAKLLAEPFKRIQQESNGKLTKRQKKISSLLQKEELKEKELVRRKLLQLSFKTKLDNLKELYEQAELEKGRAFEKARSSFNAQREDLKEEKEKFEKEKEKFEKDLKEEKEKFEKEKEKFEKKRTEMSTTINNLIKDKEAAENDKVKFRQEANDALEKHNKAIQEKSTLLDEKSNLENAKKTIEKEAEKFKFQAGIEKANLEGKLENTAKKLEDTEKNSFNKALFRKVVADHNYRISQGGFLGCCGGSTENNLDEINKLVEQESQQI